jgi:hypothetical protein
MGSVGPRDQPGWCVAPPKLLDLASFVSSLLEQAMRAFGAGGVSRAGTVRTRKSCQRSGSRLDEHADCRAGLNHAHGNLSIRRQGHPTLALPGIAGSLPTLPTFRSVPGSLRVARVRTI